MSGARRTFRAIASRSGCVRRDKTNRITALARTAPREGEPQQRPRDDRPQTRPDAQHQTATSSGRKP